MAERLQNMADGSSSPEIKSNPNVVISPEPVSSRSQGFLSKLLRRGPQAQVLVKPGEHSRTPEEMQRLEDARKFLAQTKLTDAQKEAGFDEDAILRAHYEAAGEKGKDGRKAGIGNYKVGQLLRKAEILKDSFTPEQRRVLMEEKIVGILPPTEFDSAVFDPDSYQDPTIRRIARQIQASGNARHADEHSMTRIASLVEGLRYGGGTVTIDETEAQDILDRLDGWRIQAERIVSPENIRQPSLFEQTLFNIVDIQNLPAGTPDKQARLDTEITHLNELIEMANAVGLYQSEKPDIYDLLRMGRIDLSIREKREGAKLRHIADAKTRSEQTSVESEVFWNDPKHPERRQLRAVLGGAVDYFRRGSAALVNSVARNPLRAANGSLDILADRDYSDIRAEYVGLDGIMAAWTHGWEVNSKGTARRESSDNFEDLRKKLEQERQERPRFMKHPWYHSIEFFADNMSELGEATRDVVKHVIANLPRGESKVMIQSLQQEQAAVQSAYADAVLFFEREAREAVVMWTSSEMNSNFSMSAIGYMQRTGGKGVESGGFKYFTDSWAEGLRKTATSVNYEDALTLDEEGMFLYIAERLCEDDGAFYRFGTKSAKLPSPDEQKEYLARRRKEIIADAASHRLRSMDEQDLLKTFDANDTVNPLILDPRQPEDPYFRVQQVFMKLKATFDEIDAETIRLGGTVTRSRWDIYVEQNIGSIPVRRAFAQVKAKCDLKDAKDVLAGKTITESRWDVYKREAKAWEDFARLGQADNRDPEAKVKFVHPLARIWSNDQEFFDMYEEMDPSNKAVIDKRRERAEYLLDMVENYLRFNMIDVRSGSARIKFRKTSTINGHTREANTVEVYTNVLRDELKEVMVLDEARSPLDKRFKVTYILRKMGYQPGMPAYGMFTLGADDTIRNQSIVKHFEEEPEFRDLFLEVGKSKEASDREVTDYRATLKQRRMSDAQIEADPTLKKMIKLKKYVDDRLFRGSNAKSIIVKFTEDERLAVQAVQRAIRHPDNKKYGNSGGDYENFPGNDNELEEGGVKYWKNHLYPDFGTSRGTVRINGLIPFINFGVLDRISELGGWTPKYITGLRHREDEIELAEEGSLLIDPKDTQDYLSRLESISKKRSLWSSAGDAEKKPGILMGGVFSGMFRLRELGERGEYFKPEVNANGQDRGIPKVIEEPDFAWKNIRESGKRAFLETMGGIVEPIAVVMRANRELETGYGYAQGTSKDMNTLLMNDIFYWMDKFWNEYQGDYGYAVDGMLHMSRELMYVYLKEEGLIWPEEQIVADPKEPKASDIEGWKDISERLIKDLPEDLWNGVPLGSLMYPERGSVKVKDQSSRYHKAPTREKIKIEGAPLEERDKILGRLRTEIVRQRGI